MCQCFNTCIIILLNNVFKSKFKLGFAGFQSGLNDNTETRYLLECSRTMTAYTQKIRYDTRLYFVLYIPLRNTL